MIAMGLTHKQKIALHDATLLGHHQMRVRVQSTYLDGKFDRDLTDLFLDGQVDIDMSADVSRSASITLLDPTNALDFDADSPGDAALFLDRMLRIWYGIRADLGNGYDWYDIPVFTGPITSLSRTGATAAVEAQGKEVLAMGAVWRPLTIPKGKRKVHAIRAILAERAGETRFDLPDLPPRLPKPLTLARTSQPWRHARELARSLGHRQLFYDGRGVCRLRNLPQTSSVDFDQATMLSELQVSYAQDAVVNAVWVRGGVPKGKKDQITAQIFARSSHPLSPSRLGRNGVPRYLMEVIEDSKALTQQAVFEVAKEHLQRGLAQAVDATVDVMPWPLLEPGDMVRCLTDEGAVTFRAKQFSIPLSPGEPMTLGYNRNVSPRRRHGKTRLRTRGHVTWVHHAQYKAAHTDGHKHPGTHKRAAGHHHGGKK